MIGGCKNLSHPRFEVVEFFPKTGSLESNLCEHVNGKAHNVAVRASVGTRKHQNFRIGGF
jgi:hypothetical protein